MDFYEHTNNWFKGELFEGSIILISGITILVLSFLTWKIGTTPNAKSFAIVLLVVGLVFSGISFGFQANKKRMVTSDKQYKENPVTFVQQEKQRVEGFQWMYKISAVVSGIFFALTFIAFMYSENRIILSIALGLMIIGSSLILIDYFSKERAAIYYQEILKEQAK